MSRIKQHNYLGGDASYDAWRARGEDYLRGENYTVRQSDDSAVSPAFTFEFHTPPVQAKPLTAASLASAMGNISAGDVVEIFDLGTVSGSIAGELGSYTFDEVNTPTRDQTAVCFDGTDWSSRRASEVAEGTFNGFVATSTAFADLGTANNVAILTKVRFGSVPTTTDVLWEKRNAGFGAGYEMRITTTGLVLLAEDALGDISSSVSLAADTRLYDGAWHYVLGIFDFTNNRMVIDLDFTTVSATSVLNTGQSFASTNAFRVMTGWNRQSANVQVDYCAIIGGSSVASMSDAGNYWTLGSDVTALLTDARHASLLSDAVAEDDTLGELVNHWHGDASSGHGVDQLSYGYYGGSLGVGVGLGCWPGYTNLCTQSENLATSPWTAVGTTRTANSVDAPDGFLRATLCDGTGATGYVASQTFTVSNDTTYTFSVWLKLKDSASGTIRFRWQNSFTAGANQDTVVTNKWKRYTFTFTTASTGTGATIRIYTGDGVSVLNDYYAWGAQFVAGAAAGPYVRTFGSTAAMSLTHASCDDSNYVTEGGVYAVGCIPLFNTSTGGNQSVWDNGVSADRRVLYRDDGSGNMILQVRDQAATVVGQPAVTDPLTAGVEFIAQSQWKEGATPTIRNDVDGTEANANATLDPGVATKPTYFGSDSGVSVRMSGYIAKLDSYDQEFMA
jgi:hypothetical protein